MHGEDAWKFCTRKQAIDLSNDQQDSMISPEMSIHQAFFAEVHNTICSGAVKIASLIW